MPYEYTPPKYAQLIQEIQRRIESGEYPAGSPLPSEHQLSQMFHVARATVARALQVLRQDGWIVTQQGRGSFARGRPPWIALKSRTAEGAGLDRDEAAEQGDPVEVDVRVPSARVAEILGGDSERPVVVRQRLLRSGQDACELVSWWVPADLADGTGWPTPSSSRAASSSTWRSGRACESTTSLSRSPPGTPPPARSGCWTSKRRPPCWSCTWPPTTSATRPSWSCR